MYQREGKASLSESLPASDVAARVPRLRERLASAGCDAFLVTKIENVRYLTGFTGSSANVFVDGEHLVVTTDGRYQDQIVEQLASAGVAAEVYVGRSDEQRAAVRKVLTTQRLGLEAGSVSWSERNELAQLLTGVTLVPTKGLVETLRRVKDAGELARIERAAEIADVALAQVKSRLAEEISEREFAAELEFEMRRRGADGPSFDTIVASGPNSALPHAQPSSRRIQRDEMIVLDFGALVDGYHSDMTRTLCVGKPPPQLAEAAEAVLASQRAGRLAVRPGATAAEVDAACREVLVEAGYGDAFLHPSGHGVGLEIHETPILARGAKDVLQAGEVVTVEPGAYLHGIGGIRIEDTVVVEDQGARALSRSTKDMTL